MNFFKSGNFVYTARIRSCLSPHVNWKEPFKIMANTFESV